VVSVLDHMLKIGDLLLVHGVQRGAVMRGR
jgi:hypothetical protein